MFSQIIIYLFSSWFLHHSPPPADPRTQPVQVAEKGGGEMQVTTTIATHQVRRKERERREIELVGGWTDSQLNSTRKKINFFLGSSHSSNFWAWCDLSPLPLPYPPPPHLLHSQSSSSSDTSKSGSQHALFSASISSSSPPLATENEGKKNENIDNKTCKQT